MQLSTLLALDRQLIGSSSLAAIGIGSMITSLRPSPRSLAMLAAGLVVSACLEAVVAGLQAAVRPRITAARVGHVVDRPIDQRRSRRVERVHQAAVPVLVLGLTVLHRRSGRRGPRCHGHSGPAATDSVRPFRARDLLERRDVHPGVAVAEQQDVLAGAVDDGAGRRVRRRAVGKRRDVVLRGPASPATTPSDRAWCGGSRAHQDEPADQAERQTRRRSPASGSRRAMVRSGPAARARGSSAPPARSRPGRRWRTRRPNRVTPRA